jgi:TolB-like protein/Tfp pilus assembly protein PilF
MTTDLRERLQASLGSAYVIERELGGGGMSRVFVAEETALGRRVAVKVLPPELASEVSAERFRREMLVTARLQHPHILPVLAAGARDGLLYYITPYVPGESLRGRLEREGRLPMPDAVRIVRELADALACAHGADVVHRDVKPANVLLAHGHAVLADFGVARALAQATLGERLTSTGLGLGTLGYMAPEQLAGEREVDGRADLYALGVIGYEMLAGAPPFAGSTPQRVVTAQLGEVPRQLGEVRPEVPPALAALVMRLLEKDPADRPQSADEVLRALDAAGPASGAGTAAHAEHAGHTAHPAVAARHLRHRRLVVFAVVALVLGAAAYGALAGGYGRLVRSGRGAAAPAGASTGTAAGEKSVAVLPFVNIGGDTATEYFADGMTEELIATLGKAEGLKVAARTSSFAFKGKSENVAEIGRRLNVGTVVEGSVRRAGGRLRVSAQLVSAADGYQLWSETYDRELRDVFRVQDEISRAIVGALRLKLRLALGGGTTLVRAATADPEAHDLYLRGRFLWNQRTYESLLQAVRYFERAIERDPSYAEAYAGLADTYVVLPVYGPARPREAYAKAKTAALRALAGDSTLADAHAALGYARMFGDYDWPGGEREVRRAMALDPNYAPAHQRAANYFLAQNRPDEAATEAERARALDPLSRVIGADAGTALGMAGRFDEALRVLRATLELDPNFARAHTALCDVYLWQRKAREAVAACERAAALSGRELAVGPLAYAYAAAGERARAAAVLGELEDRRRRTYVRSTAIAVARLGLGDVDAALAWLDSAVAEHDPNLDYLWAPIWAPLHADPRFARLRVRMGLRP